MTKGQKKALLRRWAQMIRGDVENGELWRTVAPNGAVPAALEAAVFEFAAYEAEKLEARARG